MCKIKKEWVAQIAELQVVMGSGRTGARRIGRGNGDSSVESGGSGSVRSAITGTTATGRLHNHIPKNALPAPLTKKERYLYDVRDWSYAYTDKLQVSQV